MFILLAVEAGNIIGSSDNYLDYAVGSNIQIIVSGTDNRNVKHNSSSDSIMGHTINSNVHDVDCISRILCHYIIPGGRFTKDF